MPTDYAIKDGRTVFDATTYTGTGGSQSVVNAGGFKPDLVWTKSRSNAIAHHLTDSVRGTDKALYSNSTTTEATYAGDISAFNSNGFTVGNDGSQSTSTYTYVGWQWKANGTAVSNTSGTLTSSVNANTTTGFSIVTYTGVATDNTNYTVGHGLGVTPAFIIIKNRGWAPAGNAWVTWHQSQNNKLIFLDSTAAADATDFTYMMPTAPSSSVFTVRSDTTVSTPNRYRTNGRTDSYVAYCWAEVAGFSKFGSYTGNGSTDGTFVYLGFRPKFILVKRTDSTSDWSLHDTSRDLSNSSISVLYPNTSGAEAYWGAGSGIDFVSNGFKLRNSGAGDNASGGTYIYMAFAENPFKYANAR